MPRGVYDRNESKIKRILQEKNQLLQETKGLRNALEKKDFELRSAKVRGRTDGISNAEQFIVLRANLQSLAEARKIMVDSDQMSPDVLSALDKEITEHINCLSWLRGTAFKAVVKNARTPEMAPKTMVPMPPRALPTPTAIESVID